MVSTHSPLLRMVFSPCYTEFPCRCPSCDGRHFALIVLTAAEAACFGLPALAVGRGRLTEGIAPDQTPLLRCP